MPMWSQIVPPLGSHALHRPWAGLQSVIVVCPDHTNLLFLKMGNMKKYCLKPFEP